MTERDLEQPLPAPVEKLRQLEEFLPDQHDIIYDFGRFLADRVADRSHPEHPNTLQCKELVPRGFVMAATLAITDIQRGVDGYTGQPIRGGLASLPEVLYPILYAFVPRIARAVYPEDFADQVQEVYNEVNTQVREARQ